MAQVILKNVEKTWASFVAVARQSLTVADGEFLVLLGPSGCGKTTTMRMVAGLEEPSGGEIWIGDRCVNDVMPKDRDIAMVFQNYGLYPHLTVGENIAYPLRVRGVSRSDRETRVAEAARKVELGNLLHRRPPGAVRRAAAACGPGPRHRAHARCVPDGRAAVPTSTPSWPRHHAGRDQAPAGRSGHHHHLRDARPDRGDDAGPPGGGDEERRGCSRSPRRPRSMTGPPTCSSPASSGRRP